MLVRIRLFAAAREAANQHTINLTLADHATVADLRRALSIQYPAMRRVLEHSRIALDADYATSDSATIHPTTDVAIIPPVSGG
jgi:molybdopterin converting factor subunit 1